MIIRIISFIRVVLLFGCILCNCLSVKDYNNIYNSTRHDINTYILTVCIVLCAVLYDYGNTISIIIETHADRIIVGAWFQIVYYWMRYILDDYTIVFRPDYSMDIILKISDFITLMCIFTPQYKIVQFLVLFNIIVCITLLSVFNILNYFLYSVILIKSVLVVVINPFVYLYNN